MYNIEWHREYARRFKATHGMSLMTAWRMRNPRRQTEHRRRERQRWQEDPQTRRRHYLHSAKHRKKLKDAAYKAYGGFICRCCGVTDEAFLTLDHIKRD